MFLKDIRIFRASGLFWQAFRNYKRSMLLLGLLGAVGGFVEGVGINALIPLFSLVTNAGEAAQDIISRSIIHFFEWVGIEFRIRNILLFVGVLFVSKALLLIYSTYVRGRIVANFLYLTRVDLLRQTLRARWPFLGNQKIGYLEKVVSEDVGQSANILKLVATEINTFTTMAMYMVVAFNISVQITLFSIVVGLVIFLALKPLLYRIRVLAREGAALSRESAHYINQSIAGAKSIKSAYVHEAVGRAGGVFLSRLREIMVKNQLYMGVVGSTIEPFSVIFVSVVFAYSYHYTEFNFISFMVVMYIIRRIFDFVKSTQSMLSSMSSAYPHLQHVVAYRETLAREREEDFGVEPFVFQRELAFNNISFSYPSGVSVLNNAAFAIRRGETVGIAGESGGGKTTIVDILLRLLAPSSGSVTVDGVPVERVRLSQWRRAIAYVPQDIFLLNDTIANNIAFFDESLTREEIKAAAASAHCSNFIKRLPKGLDTVVGERGVLLSGGQRQRIVLARTLARKPEILVLDEATSALDRESEQSIQEALAVLRGRMTIIIIAHRESSLSGCDRVLTINGGRVAERKA